MTTYDSLKRAFNPQSIAVVGATSKQGTVGRAFISNMVGSKYEGAVYPVNPKSRSMMGMKVYPKLSKIPDPIDLAIIATPPASVPALIEECGKCGIGAAVIVSAGFQEIGKKGEVLLRQVIRNAKKAKVRLIGPNCLGFIRPPIGLNASFSSAMALPGRLAFISQSGALCTAVLDWSIRENVGFSHFISIGSMADIGYHDLIDYLGQDPNTSSILIYMESIKDARRFISASRSIGKTKPIVVLKVGRSSEGAAAVSSHTGSLSGDDTLYEALFKRSGIARVDTVKELFNIAQNLSTQSLPQNDRLLIITNAGGPGILATDAHIKFNGQMASLSRSTIDKLNQVLPPAWSHGNPVDILGDSGVSRYKQAFEICLQEENADGILVVLTPQAMTNAYQIGKEIGALAKTTGKTVLASFMGAAEVERGTRVLEEMGVPVYDSPEEAVHCFNTMASYSRNQRLLAETPDSTPTDFKPHPNQARAIIKKAADSGRNILSEYEAKQFIAHYGIESTPHAVATTPAKASAAAAKLGFPVAMKILSPDIFHKTDVGGVQLHIRSQRAAATAYKQIIADVKAKAPEARIDGVLVEKMVSKKYELIIGSKRDKLFGPVIVFGMGGIGVEIFKDISVGIPPLNMALAKHMIEGTRIYKLLAGYRGMKAVDLTSLQFLLYRFSYMIMEFPEIQEIDINPLAIDETGSIALDAKIIIDPKARPTKSQPYSHLIISPYPIDWEKRIKSTKGKNVLMRAIRPEDEPLEAEMFRAMSTQTQRFRFFQLIKDITHEMLVRYTQIDYDREIAIIAEISEKGEKKMAGVARIIADPYNDTAEYAVVVADPYQKQGLGAALTDHVLKLARQRRLSSIYAHFLPDNRIIRHVLEKRGFTTKSEDGTYEAKLILKP
ncbi:acetyltransferase, GNAT family [Verrucomicrobiia bacterium DG1235]|nr:acetyltransferase, GNAT family [Verrucomicrobiae bacterium DG1235]